LGESLSGKREKDGKKGREGSGRKGKKKKIKG